MIKKYVNFLQISLFVVFFSVLPSTIYAQCAGSNSAIEICDQGNNANRTINLFTKLGGSPVTGGVWTDDNGSGGLNITNGILNAQLIRFSGIYHFTYTVNNGGCNNTSATIELTLGAYSGATSPNVTVCSSAKSFNLFNAFSGLVLGPQAGGTWRDDTAGQTVSEIVNVENMEGDFPYTYTIPAVGNCPAMSSTAVLSVRRAPNSGNAANLFLCASDGLNSYTNYDLNSLISGADPNGYWTDGSNTGELSFSGDHFIDVQNIYNKFGAGEFIFTYVVLSTNTICPNALTSVRVGLEEKLDFTGAVVQVNSDICETEIPTAKYSVTITRGNTAIPNGRYYVIYNVSGPKAARVTVIANFSNGVLSFPIDSEYFQQVGRFTVSVSDIINVNSIGACRNIINNLSDDLIIYPIPRLDDAVIPQAITCQNEDAQVQIIGASKLADGEYDIVYSISGANVANSQIARLTFVGGIANDFIVPGILNQKSGTSTITITAITNVISGCVNSANLKGEILINPLPNVSGLKIQANDVCFGTTVSASVSGLGTLTDVTLSYILSGNNSSTVQTVVLTSGNGNANFDIPVSFLLNTGSTTIAVTKLVNNLTGCSIDVENVSDPFALNPIPVAPTAVNQEFCKVDNATIASLEPKGAQYTWYDSAISTTPLAGTFALQSTNYYLRETSLGCISDPTLITVTIKDTPAPVLNDTADFCGLNNPTILDLSNKTNSPSTVVWYDAPENGNLIPTSTALVDKRIYYGFDYSASTDCFSEQSTAVTVSLLDCNSPEYPFFVPDGFSPNGDGVNDVFVIPDIDFLYPNYTIEIFNRYGNGMYKGGKDKPGWDGINYETKGISSGVAPNGVYFYIINFNKDNKPPKQGRLYLNR